MQKSMLKLIVSAETLGEKTKFLGKSSEKFVYHREHQFLFFSVARQHFQGKEDPNTNEGELFRHPEDGNELQKEVFAALFSAPEKSDEFPEITVKTKCEVQSIRKGGFLISATYWRTSGKLYTDIYTSSCIVVASVLKKNSSKLLYRIRLTCFKSWSGQPYEPAIDAFARGDHARAGKLLEQKLPNSNSMYWKALPFPDACRIFVFKCPELKKLPLDLERAGQGGIINMDGEILEQISGV
ncbi:hypothetical protein KPL70_020786 [Citrus sinensis]|nr:hypothetical protein KPL70_020786 [Citrus sinensis]